MTQLARRGPRTPLTDMFDWLETAAPFRAAWSDSYIPVEEYVADGRYVVRADLPGIDPEKDVEVNIADDALTIHGERRGEEHDTYRSEMHYGSFTRRLRLPKGCRADDVSASYDAGVLTVSMPIADAETEPVRVPIAHGTQDQSSAS
ncbi:Hsp20/alpha crystallin family protein [Nocardioides daeguensis]|uniref:Hsp20/alpha crystallin family protein n=1 Tax=Nocardioides daeguensis TaxID=908359 RepID=A0ABP6UQB3_9ACTN|nr:Hsp20/alpha crystallin family protein [Nocardioides daeguensis]MBV6728363.1 Hsp20/alpha crystallin family protein [Nocardioides daeguensis]MCR1773172.1 Hsp20/alpha crystallin family protein [Nocardioides daeguensis]